MGYIRHHAMVVTSFRQADADAARAKADELGMHPSEIIETINGYLTFFVPPDGSKEGWESSAKGDAARAELRGWLESGPGFYEWAEVQYGDEGGNQYLVAASALEASPS